MRFTRVLQIARKGHPILQQPALDVTDIFDPEIVHIIEDMKATIHHLHATGLAAPQVFIPLRLVVFRVRPSKAPADLSRDAYPWVTMINPLITHASNTTQAHWESCLSLPGLSGCVSRHDKVTCEYLTPEGERVVQVAQGHKARVIQHECDHLNGVLYPLKMDEMSQFGFREEVEQYQSLL